MVSIVHHPQPFGLNSREEERFGLSESCVPVARARNHEYRRPKALHRTNRLQVTRRNVQPRLKLDEQERREQRCERPQSDADSILDCARNSRIDGFQHDRIKAGWLRAKEHGRAAERAADDPDPARGRRAFQPRKRCSDIGRFSPSQCDRSAGVSPWP